MDKKIYVRPEIIQELELETRAGSVITPTMKAPLPGDNFPWPPGGGE